VLDFHGNMELSFKLIIKMQDWTGIKRILFSKGDTDKCSPIIALCPDTNHCEITISTDNSYEISARSKDEIELHKWTHLVVVLNSSNRTGNLFINGSLQTFVRSESDILFNKKPLYVGSSPNGECSTLYCLQDLRYYNRAFSEDQVLKLHEKLKLSFLPIYPPASVHSVPPMITQSLPLSSLAQLELWKPGRDPLNISTISLQPRHKITKRKIIHCHDMKGGYQEDRFLQGSDKLNVYNFRYWQYIDIFIYFSHTRVTIPPVGWTEAAHKNGVLVLGNFITEWSLGESENLRLLDGPNADSSCDNSDIPFDTYYADKLIQIAQYYGFDGWFFNIESKLPNAKYVNKMRDFLLYMTKKTHEVIPGSKVIWYDSVTSNGDLKWQNELNDLNKMYFDACDGIFLNYFWKPEMVERTASRAGERRHDVYVGIDVWGRGSYGGGKFDAHVALHKIVENDLSCGIFAPAWTFETIDGNPNDIFNIFNDNEDKFWIGKSRTELLHQSYDLKDWNIIENGGDGWLISTEGHNGHDAYVTSYQYCRKSQTVDVSKYTNNDSFDLSVYYRGTGPNYSDKFYVKMELRDENNNVVCAYDSGELIASEKWQRLTYHMVRPKGTSCKYLYYEHGGKDIECWKGHYGTRISCPSVTVLGDKELSISTYVDECGIAFPLISNFNTGVGKSYYIGGHIVKEGVWNNMREQDVLPTYIELKRKDIGNASSIRSCFSYENAYNGGSSLHFKGAIDDGTLFAIYRLFMTKIMVSNPSTMVASITTLATKSNSRACLILILDDGSSVVLTDQMENKTLNAISQHLIVRKLDHIKIETNGWLTQQYTLPTSIKDRTIIEIQLYCELTEPYEIYVGEIKLYDMMHIRGEIEPVKNLSYSVSWNSMSLADADVDILDINLVWDKPNEKYTYRIYQDDKYIGRSMCNMYCVQGVVFRNGIPVSFRVEPVSDLLRVGESQTCQIVI
jgi:endo-beta-N-acetylglucosaminidase D